MAAATLSAINTYFLPHVFSGIPQRLGLDFDLSEVSSGIYGLLLVIMVLLRPRASRPTHLRHTAASRSTPV